ncbi:MAG: hypothetical protein LBT34_03740 [Clostridiales Family XIII bacterium]|nr:hypothetical protein [Clostridiales Family XIII bacterium]
MQNRRKNLKVIRGGLSSTVQKSEKNFISAFVTNTRLMGVLVIYLRWMVKEGGFDSNLHQFFYVSTDDCGIESYRGVLGDDGEDFIDAEQSMLGGLGGDKIELTETEAVLIVQQYAEQTLSRGFLLPDGNEEYGFLLSANVRAKPDEEASLFRKTCAPITSNEQAINYFLMRYFAHDEKAVEYLSARPIPMGLAPNKQAETLCKNTIEPFMNSDSVSFLCESLIENTDRHQMVMSEISLENMKVSSFSVRSSFFVSASEAAMMLGRPEYVTVYDILGDADAVKKKLPGMYPGALQKSNENGVMYIQFKANYNNLKESAYRLNDDIRGIYYVTEFGQLVAVAYSLPAICKIEKELQAAIGLFLLPSAKYEFKESVFYEFVQGDFTEFSEFVDFLNDDFEPEE